MIVDSQLHLWAAESDQRPWPEGAASRTHRAEPVGAAELLAEMDAAGVARAVLVPPSWEGDRNDVALGAARAHPDRFRVMGRLPVASPARTLAELPILRSHRELLGFRFTFHRPPLAGLFAAGALDWLWAELERTDTSVMLYPPGQLTAVGSLAQRFPGLRLTVDHLALPAGVRGPMAFADLDGLTRLARFPNVAVKASCLPASSAESYPFGDVQDAIGRVFDAFGPTRMFWGSDLTRLPCSYQDCVDHFVHALPFLCGGDRELVMGQALLQWIGWP